MKRYLDADRLAGLDAGEFQRARPYPWCNPQGVLRPEAYETLRTKLPEASLFEARFGVRRAHGQRPHDRLALEYHPDLPIAEEWHAFIEELKGSAYQRFLRRMLGRGGISLSFHWHYTPRGCEVSPHCDARHKIGSHIFYFNTEEDWDPAWGGETEVLDDGGRLPTGSAPDFDDFDTASSGYALGNHSFLFVRRGNSWHGVRALRCPEGVYRKVFIVVINDRLRSIYPHHIKPMLRSLRQRPAAG